MSRHIHTHLQATRMTHTHTWTNHIYTLYFHFLPAGGAAADRRDGDVTVDDNDAVEAIPPPPTAWLRLCVCCKYRGGEEEDTDVPRSPLVVLVRLDASLALRLLLPGGERGGAPIVDDDGGLMVLTSRLDVGESGPLPLPPPVAARGLVVEAVIVLAVRALCPLVLMLRLCPKGETGGE